MPDVPNTSTDTPSEERLDSPKTKPQSSAITWEAQEYISGDKSTLWYAAFAVAVLALLAFAILILRSWSFALVIVVSVIALFVYFRSARTVTYSLDSKGLRIADRLYNYRDFKSFGILEENNTFSIILIPKKRFAPSVAVFIPEEHGEAIVDAFGTRIPMEEVKLDLLDRITKRLHF